MSQPTAEGEQRPLLSRQPGCVLLRRFFYYRLALVILLLVLFYSRPDYVPLGRFSPLLFAITAFGYLGFVLANGLLLLLRSFSCEQHAYLMVFLDIPAITLLMHASGGLETGLGLLLVISITFGSLIMRGRAALVFASIASLSILAQQIYSEFNLSLKVSSYTQAGLLGAAFFAMALLAETLSRRLRESERLVSQRELDLANLAQLNAYIIKHMQTGVLVLDTLNVVRLINDAALRLLGLQAPPKGVPLQRVAPGLQALIAETGVAGQPRLYSETPNQRELQLRLTRLGRDTAAGTLVLLEDASAITEQAQQMKLASLGRLTASIAHEIRNPLAAISHAEQLLSESPDLNPGDRRLAEIIHNHSLRVNAIVEDVLRLSRRGQAIRDKIPLLAWLEGVTTEFRQQHRLREEQLQLGRPAEPMADVLVEADRGQLRQVVENLCANALKHFDRPPELLRIQLRTEMDEAAETAWLEVTDNGPGIAEGLRNQVFEPFFTTKSSGTGLGLYLARELCEANRLRLELLPPPPEGGCRLRIGFPAAEPLSGETRQAAPPVATPQKPSP
jgi:two-component system, NtrC family, sensor histidine kinase PilS